METKLNGRITLKILVNARYIEIRCTEQGDEYSEYYMYDETNDCIILNSEGNKIQVDIEDAIEDIDDAYWRGESGEPYAVYIIS